MTTTLILQLVADGKLSLDDPVSKYVKGVPNGDEITIRELGSMTSGLADYTKDPAFQKLLIADLGRRWTDEELLSYALDAKPNFAPGTAFEYSNTNTVLLGQVVEKITGRYFAEGLRNGVFTPLGLDSTFYPDDGVVPNPTPIGYQLDSETNELVPVSLNMTALGPSGGAASTVYDLYFWGEALADGSLITPELQKERMAGARKPGENDPEYDAYGFGIGELDGWWGHTGEGLGFEALVMSDPKSGSTVVILMNLTGPPGHIPTELFREIVPILEPSSS